jgi:hypothetical protein
LEIIQRRVIALALLLTVGVWPLPGLVPRGLAEAISRERSPSDTVAESAVRSHLGRGTPTDRFFIHHPGDPVNLRTGNLTLPAIDLSIPSRGPSLTLTRTYNSRSSGKGFFGQKWQSNLEVKVMRSAGTLAVMEADGALIDFKPEGGAFAAASGGLRYRSTVRGIQQVEERPDGSVLRRTDAGNRELFDPRGRLVRIEDRNGNALRLEYRGDKVMKLVDPGGRSLILSYGGQGGQFVTTVTDAAGGVIRYQYDARGRLLSEAEDRYRPKP